MGAVEEKITEAELEVMEVLWRGEGPMSLTEIKGALRRRTGTPPRPCCAGCVPRARWGRRRTGCSATAPW